MAAILPNLKDKREVIDWAQLPSGECDLNYRPVTAAAQQHALWVFGLLVLVATATLLARPVITIIAASLCQFDSSLLIPLGVAGLVALATAVGWYQPWPRAWSQNHPLLLARQALQALFVGWLLLITCVHAQEPTIALIVLCCLAMPLTWLLADQIATHFVYWLSAHPRVPLATMLAWRSLWQRRWDGLAMPKPCRDATTPVIQERHSRVISSLYRYQTGLVWGSLGLLPWPLGFTWAECCGLVDRPGFWCVGGMIAQLLLVAVYRSHQYPQSLQLFWCAWSSFSCYGIGRRDPAWVFQSPCGAHWLRGGMLLASVELLALVVTPSLWAEVSLTRTIAASSSPWPVLAVTLYTIACPILLTLLATYIVAIPALAAYHAALEGDWAYEQQSNCSEHEGYLDRLNNSRNPLERRAIWRGLIAGREVPVLQDSRLRCEHQHILGATGIGKTALVLIPEIEQAIRRADGPVIILDGKGDRAMFHSVRLACEQHGRRFKWWTNLPQHSTYLFNPWLQKSMQKMSLEEVLGLIIQALNLHHGSDYGRSWYAIIVRILLKRALEISMFATPNYVKRGKRPQVRFPAPRSFRELAEIVRFVARDNEEFEAAQHLAFTLEALSGLEQLNAVPDSPANAKIIEHAIHMPDVIAEKQVIYFYLTGATDIGTTSETGKLVIFSAIKAAEQYLIQYGKRPNCPIFCDEAQLFVAKNLGDLLAQARSYGVHLTLAHQSMSQLHPPGGPDLREVVQACTSIKVYLSARDKQSRDYLTQASGQVAYANLKWQQSLSDLWRGDVGASFARRDEDGQQYVQVNVTAGPRLDHEDINDINRQHLQGVFLAERNEGLTQFQGAVSLDLAWPMTQAEYNRRNDVLPWPAATDETLTVELARPLDLGGVMPIDVPANEIVPEPSPTATAPDPLQQAHRLLWETQQQNHPNPNKPTSNPTDPEES